MSSPPQFPSSPSVGRRLSERHAIGSPRSSGRPVDDAQLAQDIDAARQMSRARANSTSQTQHHPASSPRTIVSPSSIRGVHSENADQATANVNDYLGVSAGIAHAATQQPSSGQAGSVGAATASFSPTFSHQPPSHSTHAAARFYMQHNRHGSNTSIDSASHFIDHRNQQGFGVPASQVSPTAYARVSGRRLSSSRHEPLTPSATSALGASLRQAGNLSHYQGAEQDEDVGSAAYADGSFAHRSAAHQVRSGSAQHPDTSGAGSTLGQGRRSERLVDVDDNEDDARSYPEQRPRPDDSSAFNSRTSPVPHLPHTPSRRPSLAEQDVCFPMHTPAVEASQQNVDLGATDTAALDPRSPFVPLHLHHSEDQPHVDHSAALPPGFPWTFDLGALEDYAGQERKRVQEEATATASSTWGLCNRSGAATIASTRNIHRPLSRQQSAQNASSALMGISPDSDDATFYSRRPRKFINLHGADVDGKSSGRYQRKLALFEGAGSVPPPVGARGATKGGGILGHGSLMEEELARQRTNATQKSTEFGAADTKTPLLDRPHPHLNSYHGKQSDNWLGVSDDEDEPVDAPTMVPSAPPPHVPRSLSVGADLSNLVKRAKGAPKTAVRHANRRREPNSEKQFRFTFYSNALPNTIHARHLYELPAPGQSFEELLMGITPPSPSQGNTQNAPPDAPSKSGEQGEEPKRSSEANATASDEHLATSSGVVGQGARGSIPTPLAPNRSISALTSALSGGRLEGTTAPNTGSNTPEQVPNARFNVSGGGGATNVGQQQPGRPSTGGGAASGTTAAAASLPAASIEKARAMPGGGFRVDQDPETCTWWLDVLCPTDQEMKTLSRAFGIHPLTTEDILMEETREKIELFRNYYLVCFRSFDQDPYSPTYLEPLNMYVIVFREGTLSFHFRATPHPQNVRRRIKQLKDYINVTSDWISYALIDDITDAFGPLIQSIEYEVDSIDELVLILKEAEQSDMLRRIGTCRKKVMGLLRLMGNKADVVKGLAKRCNENWSVAPKSDIGLYLSDIQDHLITMTQNLNHYEKILSRSHSNYLAQISIEMTDANNQINDVLSKLTALGTVIVPLNVITGLWGMNVHVPGQDGTTLDWFFGILGVMIALAVIGYFATIRYLNR